MKRWQVDKVNERLQDANEDRAALNHRHPLVLHRGDHESEEFQSILQHEEPAYIREAMTNLAVLSEVAEPSFLLMINMVEKSFESEDTANKLQEYGPVAMHLINCLMGIMDISHEQSLHMMLMTCVQQKMKQVHDRDAKSTASMVI
jgi:phage FluMu gp28-like protein